MSKEWKGKYNWEELKTKFFMSEESYVTKFLEKQWIKPNWFVKKKTRGWGQDKLEVIKEAQEMARDNLRTKLSKMYTPSEELISKTYEAIMMTFYAKAVSNAKKIKKMPDWSIIVPPDIDIWENVKMWEVIRTMRDEPTKIPYREDFVPPSDDDDDEDDVQFYLPDNWRDSWVKNEKQEKE